jgi:tetratricopeptide (TPR) repeat protein
MSRRQPSSHLKQIGAYHPAKPLPSFTEKHDAAISAMLRLFYNRKYTALKDEAKAATSLFPRSFMIWCILGAALVELGELKEAKQALLKSKKLNSNYADCLSNLGRVCELQEDFPAAIKYFRQAIEIKPDYFEALGNLGACLNKIGKYNDAIETLSAAIKIEPEFAPAWNNLGTAYKEISRVEASKSAFHQALVYAPDYVPALCNLGLVYAEEGKFEEALGFYEKALDINPKSAEAFLCLGKALRDFGAPLKSLELLEQAIAIEPKMASAHFSKAVSNLLLKNFKEGFDLYEWRWTGSREQVTEPPKTGKPEWKGQKGEKVLVWEEQGIGDTIMFASILENLADMSQSVIVKCDPRLLPLFERSFGEKVSFKANEAQINKASFTSQIAMGSLPYYFRRSEEAFLCNRAPYLLADSDKVHHIRSKLNSKATSIIGLSWASGKRQNNLWQQRSIEAGQLAAIFDKEKYSLVNLQYGDHADTLDDIKKSQNRDIITLKDIDNFNDIDGLAALISACDIVVTVDNSTAHLAGALGKKTFLLLPVSPEWRWSVSGHDSVWYSSVTLLRQTDLGCWQAPLNQLSKHFDAMACEKTQPEIFAPQSEHLQSSSNLSDDTAKRG